MHSGLKTQVAESLSARAVTCRTRAPGQVLGALDDPIRTGNVLDTTGSSGDLDHQDKGVATHGRHWETGQRGGVAASGAVRYQRTSSMRGVSLNYGSTLPHCQTSTLPYL